MIRLAVLLPLTLAACGATSDGLPMIPITEGQAIVIHETDVSLSAEPAKKKGALTIKLRFGVGKTKPATT